MLNKIFHKNQNKAITFFYKINFKIKISNSQHNRKILMNNIQINLNSNNHFSVRPLFKILIKILYLDNNHFKTIRIYFKEIKFLNMLFNLLITR